MHTPFPHAFLGAGCRAVAGLAVAFLLAACQPGRGSTGPEDPATPREAISLLNRPLFRVAPAPDRLSSLRADLAAAQAAFDAEPRSEDNAIWLGRRLAYLGRYQDSIAAFTRGLAVHPDSFRLLRHRGHRFITLRRFDDAIADLSRAAELIKGVPDETEPDGAPNARAIPRSTTHSNIYYHLGLAHFLKGDFGAAETAYRRCMEVSRVNDDMLCATSHWLYMTLRRLGKAEDAREVLEPIRADMDIIENHAYHRLLLMYKGEASAESLLVSGGESAIDDATIGYGVGNWKLYNGDRGGAEQVFRRLLEGPNWAPFGYIAAEAELARMSSR